MRFLLHRVLLILSKMANGSADDLATNVLLASDKLKIVAPAMNTLCGQIKL